MLYFTPFKILLVPVKIGGQEAPDLFYSIIRFPMFSSRWFSLRPLSAHKSHHLSQAGLLSVHHYPHAIQARGKPITSTILPHPAENLAKNAKLRYNAENRTTTW